MSRSNTASAAASGPKSTVVRVLGQPAPDAQRQGEKLATEAEIGQKGADCPNRPDVFAKNAAFARPNTAVVKHSSLRHGLSHGALCAQISGVLTRLKGRRTKVSTLMARNYVFDSCLRACPTTANAYSVHEMGHQYGP